MDNKTLNELEKSARQAILDVNELKKEISNYKAGSEAFSEAASSLGSLSKSNKDMISNFSEQVKKLDDIDVLKLIQMLESVVENDASAIAQVKKVDAGVKALAESVNKLDELLGKANKDASKSANDINAKLDLIASDVKEIKNRGFLGIKRTSRS